VRNFAWLLPRSDACWSIAGAAFAAKVVVTTKLGYIIADFVTGGALDVTTCVHYVT
jgi:hypothetical protein